MLVADVNPDSPAAKAGLQSGDIVVEFNGKPTPNRNQLRYMVAATPPGSKATVTVFRDGKRIELPVTIALLDPEALVKALPRNGRENGAVSGLGITAQNLTSQLAQQLGYSQELTGIVVTDVTPGGLADRAGIRVRDVIVSVDGRDVARVEDFRAATENADLDRGVRLRVLRDGLSQFLVLKNRR